MKYELKYKKQPNNIEELLQARGIKDISTFLHPSSQDYLNPLLLDNMEKGYQLLLKHLQANHIIDICVDCDTDGFTSAAIMYNFIKIVDSDIEIRYHLHEGKQHGLSDQMNGLYILDDLYLMICPDSSSNDYEQHKELKGLGTDILVLDHHEAEHYSPDAIVINNQLSENYENKYLSGATITFKFCLYCANKMIENKIYNIDIEEVKNLIDLAAVGAIGDMMDVSQQENRFLFKEGLRNINNFGLKVLVDKQSYSLGDITKLNPIGIAFYIVPLINALIRVGTIVEKEILFRSLIEGKTIVQSTKRGAKPGQMETIAEQNARNCTNARNRQKREEEKAMDYLNMIIERDNLDEHKVLFIEVDDPDRFDSTLTGLIAMKVMNNYHKPVILGRKDSEGYIKGSIRNNDKSELKDFKAFLEKTRLFDYVQGHANAAGASIHEANVDTFLKIADEELADIDFNEGVYSVDFIFDCWDNFGDLIDELDSWKEIWGQGCGEPNIVVENIPLSKEKISIMGKTGDTIKFTCNGIEYIQFHAKETIKELMERDNFEITIMGRGSINNFMGKETPQIIISDYNIRDSIFDF
jgi:single-stranded-DNA-specific exonuclease